MALVKVINITKYIRKYTISNLLLNKWYYEADTSFLLKFI